MNFKITFLIFYAIIGVALIGIGIFKKIKIFEGEKIEKLKELQIINTLSCIIFGFCFIAESYFCYLDKLHWGFLIASIIVVEIFQQSLFKIYIKSEEKTIEEKTTELAENIGLDEILDEDFFGNKKEKEREKEIHLQLQREKEDEGKQILEELIKEGMELGVLNKNN